MINGLAKSTTGAGAAVEYFLGAEFYDKESKEWKPRDPLPTVLEGDPEAIQLLCDSLKFKSRYTSGVLSFSPEETALIAATPGLKDAIIDDFKAFAFAGVPEDCRQFLAVEHTHTGRLEVHYLIPRVHLESGKYRNPFPPNYDGKRGAGSNYAFIEENDAYIDHACLKFGLQNPRDPTIARAFKVEQFDPQTVTKRQVHKAVTELVASGHITCREDIESFLKQAGGTITRSGNDYLSVKFSDDQKAMRFKGDFYGKDTFGAAAICARELQERQRPSPSSIEEKFNSVMAQRVSETERRHSPRQDQVEAKGNYDRDAEREFAERAVAIKDLKQSVPDFDNVQSAVHSLVADNLESVDALAKISSGTEENLLYVQTDDPTLNLFLKQVRKTEQQIAALRKKASQSSEQASRQLMEQARKVVDALFSICSGLRHGSRPGARPLSAKEIKELAQDIRNGERVVNLALQAERKLPRMSRLDMVQKLVETGDSDLKSKQVDEPKKPGKRKTYESDLPGLDM